MVKINDIRPVIKHGQNKPQPVQTFFRGVKMTIATALIKEIETLPEEFIKETLDFVLFLRSKAESGTHTCFERNDERFPGMNRPIHLGFDLKDISREALYER